MNDKESKEKKSTSEKPVSLSPLNWKEALHGLLKTKPKDDDKEKKDN